MNASHVTWLMTLKDEMIHVHRDEINRQGF